MSTKLSQTWFSEKERPISTALIGLSPVLGGLSGQALSPLVMNDNPDNLPILNNFHFWQTMDQNRVVHQMIEIKVYVFASALRQNCVKVR